MRGTLGVPPELLQKLVARYFVFHDRDIAPEGGPLRESHAKLDRSIGGSRAGGGGGRLPSAGSEDLLPSTASSPIWRRVGQKF
jgi:hypothetical protein